MAKRIRPKPTEAELAILQVLWKQGPSTVREVQTVLERRRSGGYTTTLKLMQIMLEKGLVSRDDSQRSHVYSAAVSRPRTQKQMLGQLIDQVFDGSASSLIMQALSSRKATPDELAEIRKLLDSLEDSQQ